MGKKMRVLMRFYEENIQLYFTWNNAMWISLFAGMFSGFWLFYAIFGYIFWINVYRNFKLIYPMILLRYGKRN